jgi:hypothetical protein
MLWRERWRQWGRQALARLGLVTAVPVGRAADGLIGVSRGLDRPWDEQQQELGDALEAWRKNPLARRLVGLTTAYVVGDGIQLEADYPPLARFIEEFTTHPMNRLALRQAELCDELGRSGELFLALHTNPADGMSYVRALPAARIDRIESRPGDYEAELKYHERVELDDPDYPEGRWWLGPLHPAANQIIEAGDEPSNGRLAPILLHFAVNRPVGCVRGESDLSPVLPWLRRYSRWLEDRVRLNAAVRAFLWIVRVPGNLIAQKQAEYARPPEPGSVIVTDRNSEEWQAVAPTLHAADAEADGRAIRWMVVAGGPGIGLVDLGEAETSNLATAQAMGEQRWRFMKQRQGYLGYLLALLAVTAYNRAVRLGRVRGKPQTVQAVRVSAPDISSMDNGALALAASHAATAFQTLQATGLHGPTFARLGLALMYRFAGEHLPEEDLERVLAESAMPEKEEAKVRKQS